MIRSRKSIKLLGRTNKLLGRTTKLLSRTIMLLGHTFKSLIVASDRPTAPPPRRGSAAAPRRKRLADPHPERRRVSVRRIRLAAARSHRRAAAPPRALSLRDCRTRGVARVAGHVAHPQSAAATQPPLLPRRRRPYPTRRARSRCLRAGASGDGIASLCASAGHVYLPRAPRGLRCAQGSVPAAGGAAHRRGGCTVLPRRLLIAVPRRGSTGSGRPPPSPSREARVAVS